MAASTPVTVEDTITAILQADLDANESFVAADLGKTAAEILFLRGEQFNVVKTPAILVNCWRWTVDGNPNAMGGSVDRGVARVTGLIEYADKDDQELKIKYLGWAVKQVLEGSASSMTDITTGNDIFGEVRHIDYMNSLVMDVIEGGDPRMFRMFSVEYTFMLPHNS